MESGLGSMSRAESLERAGLRLLAPFVPAKWRDVVRLLAVAPQPTPTGTVAVEIDESTERLGEIEHVVVLMLENRSFDHMLGYLSLEAGRSDVDGLTEEMANEYNGKRYAPEPLPSPSFPGPDWDPDHSSHATDHQINDGKMDGFASAMAKRWPAVASPIPTPDWRWATTTVSSSRSMTSSPSTSWSATAGSAR